MDHTPNKQLRTDVGERLPEDFPCSQTDVFDAAYDRSNFVSESSPHELVCNFSKNVASSRSTAEWFQTHGHLVSSCGSLHTMTPFGDNFSSYQRSKSSLGCVNSLNQPVPSLSSQPDSTLDPGYNSNSAGSSYQGQDNGSQRDSLTAEHGSQLEVPMSQCPSWSEGNNDEGCSLYGENELEDLLFRFKNYFENRLEAEINQFKESVRNMISEQQDHVRQIVERVASSRNQNSQNSLGEEPEKNLPDSSQPQSDVVSRLLAGTLYIPEEQLRNFKRSQQSFTSRFEKRTKLLELLADSCSLSTLLAKPEYR